MSVPGLVGFDPTEVTRAIPAAYLLGAVAKVAYWRFGIPTTVLRRLTACGSELAIRTSTGVLDALGSVSSTVLPHAPEGPDQENESRD